MPPYVLSLIVFQPPLPSKEVEKLSLELASAIAVGNEAKAKELVSRLAQSQTKLSINYDSAAEEVKAREQEIR
jgi:hypothetical protein